MAKFDYRKTQHSGKSTFEIDTIDRERPKKKKQTSKQKAAKKRRAEKTRFINKVAEKLQNNTPKSELWFKNILRLNCMEYKFLANIPLNDMIPDFINLDKRIVIEVDGSVHSNKDQIQRDLKKDKEYKKLGYTCFRVEAYNEEHALQIIKQLLELL